MTTEIAIAIIAAVGSVAGGLGTSIRMVYTRMNKKADRMEERLDECRADLAASFQRAAVDTLVAKSIRAARAEGLGRIVVAGGVGANKLLRKEIAERFDGEVRYMQKRWGRRLLEDPCYSLNLTLHYEDFSYAWPPRAQI